MLVEAAQKAKGEIGTRIGHTVFSEDWWLDIVAPGAWEAIKIEKHDRVVARWPIVRKKRAGIVFLTFPSLTPRLGPSFLLTATNPAEKTAFIRGTLQELIAKLPKFNSFDQFLSSDIDYWLPFSWTGFDVIPRCTYRIPQIQDLDGVWRGMRDTLRNTIKKAEKIVRVSSGGSFAELETAIRLTFARQSMDVPFSFQTLENLVSEARRRERGEIFVAKDAQGRIHAAAFLVWDESCAYYLLSGADPELRSSGALPSLVWTMIQFASRFVRIFDFEGSNIESIERFFSSFGGLPTSYFRVRRVDLTGKVIIAVRTFQTRFLSKR